MSTALALPRHPERVIPSVSSRAESRDEGRGAGLLQAQPKTGYGTAVATLEGTVSAFFALEGYDRRTGVATYGLRVVNRTRSALVCRTWVVSQSGDAALAHPIFIEIAPLSTSASQVPVWPGDFASFHRAIAEIAGEGIHCIVEAPAPPRPHPLRTLAVCSVGSTFAGFVALLCALTLHAMVPGSQSVARAATTQPVTLRPSGGAQIEAVAVNPVVAKPGETVDVAYSAVGDGGYVQLLGTDGTIWQQHVFSRKGQAEFVVPPVPYAREMRVVVHVTRGKTTAQSMAGLVVAAPAAFARAAAGQVVADDQTAPAASAPSEGNGVFELAESTVKSGGSIHVHIVSPRNGMHIAVTDAQSHELSSLDVGAEATDITLRAPVVYVPTRYTVVANFTDGFGAEAVVEPLTVSP